MQLPSKADNLNPALAYTQDNIHARVMEDEARADIELTANMAGLNRSF